MRADILLTNLGYAESRNRAQRLIESGCVYANGEYTDKVYEERPPAPPKPAFNPAEYLRKDEFDDRVNAIVTSQVSRLVQNTQPTQIPVPKRVTKKEASE